MSVGCGLDMFLLCSGVCFLFLGVWDLVVGFLFFRVRVVMLLVLEEEGV